MVRKICASLFLVLVVCSLVMSTEVIFTEKAFATPICQDSIANACSWHENWYGFKENPECCCATQQQHVATCL
jgi:hypothetical protein